MATPIPAAPSRRSGRPSELLRFAISGLAAYAADVVVFNIALLGLGIEPLASKALSSVVAITVAFLGSRYYTWPAGPRTSMRRAVMTFITVSVAAAGVQAACLWVTHHLLGLTSALADNLSANVLGMGAATLLRYWAFRRFVFAPLSVLAVDTQDRRPQSGCSTQHPRALSRR